MNKNEKLERDCLLEQINACIRAARDANWDKNRCEKAALVSDSDADKAKWQKRVELANDEYRTAVEKFYVLATELYTS